MGALPVQTFNAYAKQSINLHRGADAYPEDLDKPPSLNGFNLEQVSAEVVSKLLVDRNSPRQQNRWRKVLTHLKKGVLAVNNKNAVAGARENTSNNALLTFRLAATLLN